jgi:hypothetical protein
MLNDVYYNPTKVIFGKGTDELVGQEVARYSKKVLLHYGSQSAVKSGLIGRVIRSLQKAGVEAFELGGVQANPRYALANEGIKICRENGIGFILAVGGGSVIDSAKAIAVGAVNEGDTWQRFYMQDTEVERALPVATVLTIPGAGSESSTGSVVSNDETCEKLACNSDLLRPVFSILNPELTYTVPAYHTAAGITDGIAHIFERYFTNTKAVDVSDRMCEGMVRSLMRYAPVVMNEPENYDARAEIMWACKLAHDNTVGVGREQDWGSHMIEHELSALYDVSHGAGLSVIFPAWMKVVYKKDIGRFLLFAIRMFDVEYRPEDPEWTIKQGIARLEEFFKSIGMPITLRELGIKDKTRFDEMAKAAADHSGGSVGSFAVLKEKDIREILEMAF